MKIDAYASAEHYAAHIQPIWEMLPDEARGEFYAPRAQCAWASSPLPPRPVYMQDTLTLVASFVDAKRFAHRACVYIEHGAGQDYRADPRAATNGSYAGGLGLDNVVLFLSPREEVAQRWRDRYPQAHAIAIGCPRLDKWHRTWVQHAPAAEAVGITWHWHGELVAETLSAWPHYRAHMSMIRGQINALGYELIGHSHPRMHVAVERTYAAAGIEFVRDIDEFFLQSKLLIADNTSALPEFASLDRPLVWLNAPWYRRDVHHGGRFWEWPIGQVVVDEPDQLAAGVVKALSDPPEIAQARRDMVKRIYTACDGQATARAVAAIMGLARSRG